MKHISEKDYMKIQEEIDWGKRESHNVFSNSQIFIVLLFYYFLLNIYLFGLRQVSCGMWKSFSCSL